MLGIGIITYNRSQSLKNCITKIQQYKNLNDYHIIVANDGSSDDTVEISKTLTVSVITGENKGVCWNKNRALYYFMEYSNLDNFILLEDDCEPCEDNWTDYWIKSIQKWHHINYADMMVGHGDKKFKDFVIDGDGSSDNPFQSKLLTGSCTGCSRYSIEKIGYLNTLFSGYGYGHVEWTNRFLHQNIGKEQNDKERLFRCIIGGIKNNREKTWRNSDQLSKNKYIYEKLSSCKEIKSKFVFPWIEESEKKILTQEVENRYVAK
jgi:glycosyltransferase involved in cell wall biosynthesis